MDFFLYLQHILNYSWNVEITFAKWWWVVPLRGMSWNTPDNDLTNEFIAFVTEETQNFSCLVTVLVQGLVAIIGNARVWAWIIFYWQEKKGTFKNKKPPPKNKKTTGEKKKCAREDRNVQKRDLQTHFGLRSLHLESPMSLIWQEIWLGPSSW